MISKVDVAGTPIDRDGVKLEGFDKSVLEHYDRNFVSAIGVYAGPFTTVGWRQATADLKREERKCQIPALQERIMGARVMASKMPEGASPWDALTMMFELSQQYPHVTAVDGVARRYMREACDRVMRNEFIGGGV